MPLPSVYGQTRDNAPMSLEPFRLVIPHGPLTPAAIQAAIHAALTGSPPKTIRWAIVATTTSGWVVEGVEIRDAANQATTQ